MFKTLLVKQFIGDLTVNRCVDVSARQDISVIQENQINIWSLPRYPKDDMFPMQHTLVHSAALPLDLTPGVLNRNLLESALTNNELMNLYLDHTLSPSDEHHHKERRAFQLARWSPPVLSASVCLLGTLQVDHNFRLHRIVNQEWEAVLSVSDALADMVRREHQAEIDQLQNIQLHWEYFTSARSLVYRMAIVNFAWAVPSNFDRRLHLALALKDGSIRFAVVHVSYQSTEITISPSLSKPFEKYDSPMNTAPLAVVCLRCIAINEDIFIVLVGYSDGTCYAVKVLRDCTYDFQNEVALWSEDDDISAKEMFASIQNETLVVTIVKGVWLCIAKIDIHQTKLIGEVLSIKTEGKSECTACHATNIPAADDCLQSFILIYPNNKTLHCMISQDLRVEVQNLGLEVTSGYHIFGSGESNNGVLLYVVEKMACMSDKLMLTGANKFKIISTVPLEIATATIVNFFEENGDMLYRIKDYLDIVYYYFQKSQRLPEDISSLTTLAVTDSSKIKDLSSPQILLIRLILLWSPASEFQKDLLSILAREVLRRRYLFILANNYTKTGLTDLQQRSLSLFSDFLLETNPELSRDVYAKLRVAPSTKEKQHPRDTCELCNEPVHLNLDDPSTGVCSRNHKTSRCMYSLLLARTTDLMSQCLTCEWFALNADVWERPVECLLCGLPMTSYP